MTLRHAVLLGCLTWTLAATAAETVRTWDFDGPDSEGWTPTRHTRPIQVRGGALSVETTGGDPGIILQSARIEPGPGAWLEVRLRTSHTGNAQVFWFPEGSDRFGEATFHVPRAGEWLDLAVFPAWGHAGPLRALRLDVYHVGGGCAFEIDRIALRSWPLGRPAPEAAAWVFTGPGANARWEDWRPSAQSDLFFAPRLDAKAPAGGGWATVRMRAATSCVPAVVWHDAKTGQQGRQPFPVRGDGAARSYSVQLSGQPAWSGACDLVGLELPLCAQSTTQVGSLALGTGPSGPPELYARVFGFEDGQDRAGRPRRLTALVENVGGSPSAPATLLLSLAAGLRLLPGSSETVEVPALEPGERTRLSWQAQGKQAGSFGLTLRDVTQNAVLATASVALLPAREMTPAAYVPEPVPVATDVDVFMFYFPGWDSPARWAPIRTEAPERKPLLGWYDEANPECVDWQIKWAVENGIRGFILDWYWNRGEPHLAHWLRAYRQARYRDRLKLFLLWCDHAGNDVRSLDDMRAVTRYWLSEVFTLPGYHRLDGRPVVAVFEPHLLRAALGGPEKVREALEASQAMARETGFPGIAFLSAGNNVPTEDAALLVAEGYHGITTYHEPGRDYHDCPNQQMRSYEKQVRTAPAQWEAAAGLHPALAYYPVVDSGWDSRPWHGYQAPVVWGRTPALFEEWLRLGREFCAARHIPMLVLGPANEWGEGSYLEPCTEFGFAMLEAVRRVFGKGDPAAWPENLSPEDVARGPYDLDTGPSRRHWSFDDGLQGWTAGSGCVAEVRDGVLQIRATHDDPTLVCAVDLRAETVSQAVFRLGCRGGTPKPNYAELFWATEGAPLSAANRVGFTFADAEQPTEYRVPLSTAPRWRGRIVQLRFDPGCEAGLTVLIDDLRLE